MKSVFLFAIFFVAVCNSAPLDEVPAITKELEPFFNAESDVRFYLFSRRNPTISQQIAFRDVLSLVQSNYNSNLPTRVIIHGFQSDASSDVNVLLTAAFLRHSDVNVIVVDWSAGAGTINYVAARNRVVAVGNLLARFLDFLHENEALDFNRLLVAGHSLGAHIAGIAGKNVRRGRINTVIGMDPAGPLFDANSPVHRLDSSDADYVESIHTDTVFGISAAISHVDFFPNNGQFQPGCLTAICDHSRAVLFYAESINSNLLRGNRCTTIAEIRDNIRCLGDSVVMGSPNNFNRRGIYQVVTNRQSPFGRG